MNRFYVNRVMKSVTRRITPGVKSTFSISPGSVRPYYFDFLTRRGACPASSLSHFDKTAIAVRQSKIVNFSVECFRAGQDKIFTDFPFNTPCAPA
jgi:hypothetical protein